MLVSCFLLRDFGVRSRRCGGRDATGLSVISHAHPKVLRSAWQAGWRPGAAANEETGEEQGIDARGRLRAVQDRAVQAQPRAGPVRLAGRAVRIARRAARPDA